MVLFSAYNLRKFTQNVRVFVLGVHTLNGAKLRDLRDPGNIRLVIESVRRRFFKSTTKPKCSSRSVPMIGEVISAMQKVHVIGRRRFRSRVSRFSPYVLIRTPLAMNKGRNLMVVTCSSEASE